MLSALTNLAIELETKDCISQTHCSTYRPWAGVRPLNGAFADTTTWLVVRRDGDDVEWEQVLLTAGRVARPRMRRALPVHQ